MRTLTTRVNRVRRFAVAVACLLLGWTTVAHAEGWNDIDLPHYAPVTVTTSGIVYADGSTLSAGGTYVTNSTSYSEPAASYDFNGNLCYPEGTVLHPDGSWTSGGAGPSH